MGFFDRFRRKREPGLFDASAALQPGEPHVESKSWSIPGGSALSVTVTSGETQILDASTDPALHDQVLDALRQAGIDPDDLAATAQGFTRLTALPGGGLSIPAPSGNLVEDLARLAQLRSSGALTDDEFAAAKAQLLGSQPPPAEPPPAA